MIARAGRLVALGAGLVVAFAVLVVLAYALPQGPIRSHLGPSAEQLRLEGHPHSPFVGLSSLTVDNYTDSLMLNQALGPEGVGPVQAAFGNYMRVVEGQVPGEQLPVESLEAALAGSGGEQISYARYWHGYQVALRPLLIVFDYRAIRWLNALVLGVVAASAALVVGYRLGPGVAGALVVSLLAVGVVVVPMSMQFSGVFYVALAGVAFVALKMERDGTLRRDLETFLVIGALTSFIDLLTAPILTLGLPLAVLLLGRLRAGRADRLVAQLRVFGAACAAWAAGYFGAWAAKWALSSLVLGRNVMAEAMETVAYRLGGAEAGVVPDRLEILAHNAAMLFPIFGFDQSVGVQWGVVAVAAALQALVPLGVLVLVLRHPRRDGTSRRTLGLLPVALLPVGWYLIAANHSWVHHWFTYRALGVTIFVAAASAAYLIDPAYVHRAWGRIETRLRWPVESGSERTSAERMPR